jgi:hypothetical protein
MAAAPEIYVGGEDETPCGNDAASLKNVAAAVRRLAKNGAIIWLKNSISTSLALCMALITIAQKRPKHVA